MPKDYGPYGKGLDGYVHYMQAFNESANGRGNVRKQPSIMVCLGAVIMVLGIIGGVLLFVATVTL